MDDHIEKLIDVTGSRGVSRCAACAIRHRAVCGALTDVELEKLSHIAKQRKFKAEQIIMSDDEPSDFFANIVSGTIKLTKLLPDGRQQIVGLQFAPDFLGRTYGAYMPYYAEAATDVELCSFPRKPFEEMLEEFPGLEHRLFKNTLDELDSAREWMLLLGRKTAKEKIASFLYMLAERAASIGCGHSPVPEAVRFTLPLTRADMADYLGLTIETVSRQITRLKTEGLIQVTSNREIIVPHLSALSQVGEIDVKE